MEEKKLIKSDSRCRSVRKVPCHLLGNTALGRLFRPSRSPWPPFLPGNQKDPPRGSTLVGDLPWRADSLAKRHRRTLIARTSSLLRL